MPVPRQRRAALLTAVLSLLLLIPLASPANAQEAFRFWGYYSWQNGAWAFAQTGPDQTNPADGAVEGWRFAVSPAEGAARTPRATADFQAICGANTAGSGQKRVAVIIDPGVAAEAPEGETAPVPQGECAVVPADANGIEVLRAVATLRLQNALVCGIDGYPRTECGAPYDGPAPIPTTSEAPVQLQLPAAATSEPESQSGSASGSDSDDGFPVGIAVAAVLVVAVGAGAFVLTRRRSSGT